MADQPKVKILFVCMGNICRSPTAQGVFEAMLEQAGLGGAVEVDSAGTHAYHVGEPPDSRAQEAASRRGYNLSTQRARRVDLGDLMIHDYVVAMDRANYADLRELAGDDYSHKIRLFMEFATEADEDGVPDPYYGGPRGFERVLDLIEAASAGLIEELRRVHGL